MRHGVPVSALVSLSSEGLCFLPFLPGNNTSRSNPSRSRGRWQSGGVHRESNKIRVMGFKLPLRSHRSTNWFRQEPSTMLSQLLLPHGNCPRSQGHFLLLVILWARKPSPACLGVLLEAAVRSQAELQPTPGVAWATTAKVSPLHGGTWCWLVPTAPLGW